MNLISVKGLAYGERTLKVFMAPEFFFRGKNGAYPPELVSQIIPNLKENLGAGWDDWLFVFGTAVAAIDLEVTYCYTCGPQKSSITRTVGPDGKTTPKCSNDTGKGPEHEIMRRHEAAEVQNVALIAYRSEAYVVAKEYIALKDYEGATVTKSGTVIPGTVTVHAGTTDVNLLMVREPFGNRRSSTPSIFDDERMGGCILNIAGLTVGVEVCLDHTTSMDEGLGRASRYAGIIQLLLIPSFGMKIFDRLYCRDGGVVFNVDGRGTGRSYLAVKNGTGTPTKSKAAVGGGSGSVEVWTPISLPHC
jgi:hypothetical protein